MYLSLIIEGLILGATLSILLGPIFVTITQIAIQRGSKAGLVASSGVWVSDLMIFGVCYFFIHRISQIVQQDGFTFWMGLLGSIVLIIFGIGVLVKESEIKFNDRKTKGDYLTFWLKGFAVNTFNPFTFVFWIGVASTYVIGKKIDHLQTVVFFSSILAVIVFTDTMKVLLAKVIRKKMNPYFFNTFSKIAGVCLIVFGVVLLLRSQGIF